MTGGIALKAVRTSFEGQPLMMYFFKHGARRSSPGIHGFPVYRLLSTTTPATKHLPRARGVYVVKWRPSIATGDLLPCQTTTPEPCGRALAVERVES